MLKVCLQCTCEYAHSLEQCPNCTHTEFVWNTDLPDGWRQLLDTHKATLADIVAQQKEGTAKEFGRVEPMERPKDSDSAEKWKAFARNECVRKDIPHNEWPDIANMTRNELVKAFGSLDD